MAAIGSLIVSLEANIAQYTSSMDKAAALAESRARQIDKSIGFVNTALKTMGAAFLAGITFDKLKSKIEGVIETAAGLQQLAERTGAAVEALSGLAGVAKLSNTDTESLATGLQKLSKSMVDAENGGVKTSAAFKAIGISTADLKGKAPDQVFQMVAKSLAGYEDGAGKVVVMQNLMGKSGANLLPVMKDLAAVGELQVKVTKEQAEVANEYQRTLVRLNIAQDAVFKIIAMELLPIMSAFAEQLLETTKQTNGIKSAVGELAKDNSIRDWAQNAAIAFAYVVESVTVVIKAIRAIASSFESVWADINVVSTFQANGGLTGLLFEKNRKEIAAALEARNKTVEDSNKRYADLWNYDSTSFSRGLKERFAVMNQGAGPGRGSSDDPRRLDRAKELLPSSILGNANLPTGPQDDPARKIMEGKIKEQEAFMAAEKTQLQTREQYLDFFRGLDYFTLRDTEEKKQSLISESLKSQLDAFDKEEAAAKVFLAQAAKDVDRQDAKNKLAEIAAKRTAAQTEASKQLGDSQNKLLEVGTRFDMATEERARQAVKNNLVTRQQIDLLGKNTLEVLKATEANKIQADLQERIYKLQKDDPTVDTSKAIAQAAIETAQAQALITENYEKQRGAIFGADEALRKYAEDAGNKGAQMESALTNAFKGMEDALVGFVTTGKISFSSLVDSIIADLTRMIIKEQMSKIIGGGGWFTGLLGSVIGAISGTSGVASAASSMGGDSLDNFIGLMGLSGSRAGGGPVSGGASYLVGEKGPEIFTPSGSGSIIPNGGSSQSGQGVTVVQNFTVGDVASISMVRQAVAGSEQRIAGAMSRSMQYGGALA